MKKSPDPGVSFEYLFSNGRFRNAEEFSIHIEKRAHETRSGFVETLMEYCAENDIEPESVAKSLTDSLKGKIEFECEQLNLLKTKSVHFPE